MTVMAVARHNGMVLTYDTNDVEDVAFSTPSDVRELPPQPGDEGVRRELGQAHLHLSVHFKPGKRARWMSEEELISNG